MQNTMCTSFIGYFLNCKTELCEGRLSGTCRITLGFIHQPLEEEKKKNDDSQTLSM